MTIWRLKKSHSNDKFLEKITFIEARCIYSIHTGAATFEGLWVVQIQVAFTFIKKKRPNKYRLYEVDLIFYM